VGTVQAEEVAPSPPVTRRAAGRGRVALSPLVGDARPWWTVAGLTLILWGFRLFGYVDTYPLVSIAVVVLALWGIGTIAVVWQQVKVPSWVERSFSGATLGLTLVGFIVWSYLQVVVSPAYGTDELAFDQYAAQLLRHGANPYVHSMAPAFHLFHVSPDGYTFLLNGHAVTSLSYPALSFLVYVPFLLLGWSTQLAVAVNVAAWAVGIVVAFVLLPRPVRPLAIVVGSLSVYVGYAVGGVTDALFVPLLVGAVYQWDRFAWTKGWRAWRGPVLLGLAMAVKQTPWLVLPFLVAGIALESRQSSGSLAAGVRRGARYLAIALGAFCVPNLAFIVMSPHAWLSDVLTPVASHTVPAGQGLVELSLFLGIGGGSLETYSVAVAVVFVALWAAYVVTYPRLKTAAVIIPSVVLFFSARSLGSYLVTVLPAVIVAAFSVRGETTGGRTGVMVDSSVLLGAGDARNGHATNGHARSGDRRNGKGRRGVPGRGGFSGVLADVTRYRVPVVVCLAIFASQLAIASVLTSKPPLEVRITSVRTTGQLATVVQVGVRVTNTTGRAVTPSFTIESGGVLTAFWLRGSGPPRLMPGKDATYMLLAPNFFAQPPLTGGFQVVAFTQRPDAVSRSAAYTPTTWHVSLSPDSLSRVVPLDTPVVVQAQILDPTDRPVHLAGEPVYLGQIIYGQQGLLYGQAIINQGQVGQTPVVAYTDAEGVATFTIRGTQASNDPVYFEANLVNDKQFYPYGYSQILPIRFGNGP
jgi:hypothetical protein